MCGRGSHQAESGRTLWPLGRCHLEDLKEGCCGQNPMSNEGEHGGRKMRGVTQVDRASFPAMVEALMEAVT